MVRRNQSVDHASSSFSEMTYDLCLDDLTFKQCASCIVYKHTSIQVPLISSSSTQARFVNPTLTALFLQPNYKCRLSRILDIMCRISRILDIKCRVSIILDIKCRLSRILDIKCRISRILDIKYRISRILVFECKIRNTLVVECRHMKTP